MAVIMSAPASFRLTSAASPLRHLTAARALGLSHLFPNLNAEYHLRKSPEISSSNLNPKSDDSKQVLEIGSEIGEALATEIIRLIKIADFPNGISEIGFNDSDIPMLSKAAFQQKRVMDNAPLSVTSDDILNLYSQMKTLWYSPR